MTEVKLIEALKIRTVVYSTLLFSLLPLFTPAQLAWEMEQINVDSLQKVIPELAGTEKVDALNKLSLALCRDDPDSCISIAHNNISLSEQEDYLKGQGDGYFNLGMAYAYADLVKLSTINYFNALRIYEDLDPNEKLADTYIELSFQNWIAGRFDMAYRYCREALNIYKTIFDIKGEAHTAYVLSHIYKLSWPQHNDSVSFYLDHALDILDQYPDPKLLFKVYMMYGNNYNSIWEQKHDTILTLYTALDWYYMAYENIHKRFESGEAVKPEMAGILYNIGNIYTKLGREDYIKDGYDYIRQAKRVAKSIDVSDSPGNYSFKHGILLLMLNKSLAEEKAEQGRFKEAEQLFMEAEKHSDSGLKNFLFQNYKYLFYAYNDQLAMRHYRRRLHDAMYLFYSGRSNYKKALEQYQLRENMTDEINRGENQKMIAMLEADYENEKTEKKIALLARDNELKDLKVRQARAFNIGIGILFTVLILIALLFLRQNKLKNEHKNTLLEQKLFRLQMNPHFIFNALSNIMDFIEEKNIVSATRYLSSFSKLLRNTLESSRKDNIILEDEIEGLKNYMELQKLRYHNKFEYEVSVDGRLDPEDISIPPLLIQPFIENAIEHGILNKNASGQIHVHFSFKDEKVICEVADDGIGREKAWEMKYKKREAHRSLATDIIRDRILAINKKMKKKIRLDIIDLKSDNNQPLGTKVILELPLS